MIYLTSNVASRGVPSSLGRGGVEKDDEMMEEGKCEEGKCEGDDKCEEGKCEEGKCEG